MSDKMNEFIERTIEAAGEAYISVSRVTTFMQCPQKFYYRYVIHAPQESMSSALIYGKAGHAGIEAFYVSIRDDRDMSADDVVEHTAGAWEKYLSEAHDQSSRVSYSSKSGMDNPGAVKDRLTSMIKHWFNYAVMPEEVHTVEQSFRANIIDPRTGEIRKTQLVGIVDAVTSRKGERVLEEHKTAGRKWSEADFAGSLQASVYSACFPETDYMLFNILTKTKRVGLQQQTVWRTETEKKHAADTICGVMDAIKSGTHYRIRNWQCKGCAFKRQCLGE